MFYWNKTVVLNGDTCIGTDYDSREHILSGLFLNLTKQGFYL